MTLRTNRDLYAFVTELVAQREQVRPLEDYLRALDKELAPYARGTSLSLDELARVLERALDTPVSALETRQREAGEVNEYASVREVLEGQIEDLRQLSASGRLADPERYFGVDAPSGARWYNFDVATYLECGVEGSFGGWDPESAGSGRVLVPGKVAVLDDEGRMTAVDAADLQHPEVVIERVTWEDVESLLSAGCSYE